jgi:putative ABC transport system ATP-binding protein
VNPVLVLDQVTKSYGGSAPVNVLQGIDLTVDPGDFAAIVGPSGSGKSTLLHIMGTLDAPSTGRVYLNGDDITSLRDDHLSRRRARSIGFVFQQFFLLDGRSALDNVAEGLLYQGVARHERLDAARAALETVGLGRRQSHHPNELSGGERQRVAIARAIVHAPSLLLADEPTGNLDTKTASEILELLQHLHRSGTTIVVITHSQELARELPRQVEIRDGRIHRDTAALTSMGKR